MLGIGRFSGRAAAAGVIIIAVIFRGAPTAGGILAKSPPGRVSPDPPVVGSGGLGWARLPRDVLSHEVIVSRLLYDGLCRGIILLYAGAM